MPKTVQTLERHVKALANVYDPEIGIIHGIPSGSVVCFKAIVETPLKRCKKTGRQPIIICLPFPVETL
jgi:hypothetical protein